MNRFIRIYSAIVLLPTSLHPFPLIAQEGSIELPSVALSDVHIVNNSGNKLNFSLRPADGEWSEFAVSPGESRTFSCSECQTSHFEFVMRTDDKEVRYDLSPAHRYVLEWNPTRGLWDIFRVAG